MNEKDKCFCHFGGLAVKDATARKEIETIKNDLQEVKNLIQETSEQLEELVEV